ncbi:MAG: hypothetical protein JNK25_09445 [Phycisphaerae bacterium]|nr:hypothetical protein [Phycisphaerae bacterium]
MMRRSVQLRIGAAFLALLVAGCEERESMPAAPSEKAAMEMQSALESRGIDDVRAARVSGEDGWVVSVPAASAPTARAVLVELDLPREPRPGLMDIVRGFGLVPSPAQERARIMAAAAGEVATTLESVDGVLVARVHIVPPREAGLDGSGAEPGSAAVLIKYIPAEGSALIGSTIATERGQDEPSDAPVTAASVITLVERAVPGIDPARVEVVFTRAGNPSRHISPTAAPVFADWKVWAIVLALALAAGMVYAFVAAKQYFRARLAERV